MKVNKAITICKLHLKLCEDTKKGWVSGHSQNRILLLHLFGGVPESLGLSCFIYKMEIIIPTFQVALRIIANVLFWGGGNGDGFNLPRPNACFSHLFLSKNVSPNLAA